MFKQWFLKTFFRNRILLENILLEIRNVHYHLDRIEVFLDKGQFDNTK